MLIRGRQVEIDKDRKEFVIDTESIKQVKTDDIVLARVRVMNITAGRVLVNNYQGTLGAIEIPLSDLIALEPEPEYYCECGQPSTYVAEYCHLCGKPVKRNRKLEPDALDESIDKAISGKGRKEISEIEWPGSDIEDIIAKLNEVIRKLNEK